MKSRIVASVVTVLISIGAMLSVSAQMGGFNTSPSKPGPSSGGVGIGVGIDVTIDQTYNINLARSGFPRITIGYGSLDYLSMNGLMTVLGSELRLQLSADTAPIFISGGEFEISALVSNTGELISGVAGNDFVLSGSVDIDNDGVVDVSGVLLSGEITNYSGKDGMGGVLDMFFFAFSLTGGELFDEFGGTNIMITIPANISTFNGTYDDDIKAIFVEGLIVGSEAVCTGAIGDYVWEDANGNGIQDADEVGIDGIDVVLLNSDNIPQTVTTITGGPNNAPGYYQFSMLCAGDYTVFVDLGTLPPGFEPTIIDAPGSTDENDSNDPVGTPVNLPTDDSSDQTIDFGFELLLASLGDFVWLDLDQDGFQDAEEPGVPGVTVNLLDCAGVELDSTDTDADGFYSFTDLLPGCYLVEFELPDGFVFSPQFAASTEFDSNADLLSGLSEPVQLEAGEDNPTIDAGIYEPALSSLGDFVWDDLNMNGIQDAGEPGIENVMVNLLDCSGTVLDTTTTDADGLYLFDELTAGCYQVQFVLPADYVFTTSNVPGDDETDSDADEATGLSPQIDLGVNTSDLTIDAGVFIPPTSSLGDFFFLDTNANGIQDPGEPGIENVEVSLLSCAGDVLDTTTTDSSGLYLFDDLDAGCYNVLFTAPADCTLSPANAGVNDAVDSDASPATGLTGDVNLGDGDSDLTVDAGCYFTAGLGDYVWFDANEDGIQDDDEDPISGVVVELLDENMVPTGMSTVTDIDGMYSFVDLAPGKYFVQFTAPTGLVFTTAGAGMDDTIDSNASGTGKTGIVMLDSGEFDPTIDAGLFLPQDPMIDVEKATNGFDADDPTGPLIPVGGVVEWTYVVTNTGNVPLSNIVLVDDLEGAISCPFTTLEVNGAGTSSMTCTATGVAVEGQYSNKATATGDSPLGVEVMDMDPSNYFGITPSIDIEKATNGEDADDPTGPLVPVGDTVTWTYVVTNTGNSILTDVVVEDSDPGVTVVCPMTTLDPLPGVNVMTCTATGTAVLGQYANDSTVVGTPPVGPPVTDEDPSHYFGVDASITIEKLTNGVDADDPNAGDAPQVEPGDPVVWTYVVTNTGNVELTGVSVVDDRGVVVTCPMDTLGAGESMECQGSGLAQNVADPDNPNTTPGLCGMIPGPLYSNIGTATGTTPGGMAVDATDPSHYCNPNVCDISVDATCLISMPPASEYVCDKPIDTLTFIWDGSENIRIKAYKGDVGATLLADIDDIVPGQEVTVSGFAGSPNDVFYEIFEAGTSNKIGESNFHLSCSDDAMDGPEDCGGNVGNGKNDENDLINDWLLEGIIDEGGVLDCTSAPVGGADSCSFTSFPVSCETIDSLETLTFSYTGGSCADSQNSQGDSFDCEGSVNGSLPALVVLDDANFTVQPGESFVVPKSSAQDMTLSNSGGVMILDIHTSCSQPLDTGDIYGAVTLQQLNNMGMGSDVIYGYTISNNGMNDLVSLTAIDDPLGPIPGLPSTLGAGQSITLFNSTFVDMSVVNTVVVDAVDSAGAACSAVDSVDVNILPPPPCEVVGEGVLDIDDDQIKWELTNQGSSTATLESLTITWPESVHGDIVEIKVDGEKIFDGNIGGANITLTSDQFIGDPDKLRFSPGDNFKVEIKFDEKSDDSDGLVPSDYGITLNFEQGCSVTFVNTGLPFDCNKPISELSMIWDGAADPIQVKAWKGEVGSELLLDQSDINPGDRVTVSGYAGSPNDVFWEVFSGGNKLGESNFHMSCSDSEMSGAEDCGKRQGNGKGDSNMFINDWLLDGMIDADGPFNCE